MSRNLIEEHSYIGPDTTIFIAHEHVSLEISFNEELIKKIQMWKYLPSNLRVDSVLKV